MTETEFLSLAEQILNHIEQALEAASDTTDLDVDCKRNGNVLEIHLEATNSKIIVNSQAAMQEMWVAARSGGFHYRFDGAKWHNTRDGSEMFGALSKMLSEQSGQSIVL